MAGINGGMLGAANTGTSGMFTMDELPIGSRFGGGSPPGLTSVANWLIIGGGGGGGHSQIRGGAGPNGGGGGGAGGVIVGDILVPKYFVSGVKYEFQIGAGGAGGETDGGQGQNTIIMGFGTAYGGGYGGGFSHNGGASQASGGGGGINGSGGAGTPPQGHSGAATNGGGAGAVGGAGIKNPIPGSTIGRFDGTDYWIGEGSGNEVHKGGHAGSGNGGAGRNAAWGVAGDGGSFVFVLPTAKFNAAGVTGSPTIITRGSDTIVQFTSSGSYIPL